ncbi:MAG: hypothetical protein ACOC3G_03070 [Phycisphaeraceae bacterium]
MSDIVINLFVLGFVLVMGYLWFVYGLFSAFLHLIVVICAGALALAIWEPLTYRLLLGINAHLAWSAGLLAPFGILLLLGRLLVNKVVPEDLGFPLLVHNLGGAVCGLLSGILTAGLLLIGIGFLPLPLSIMGYEPYIVEADGTVDVQEDAGQLWVPVDEMTAGFFNWVSASGFSSSRPMHLYRPTLAEDAAKARLARHFDPKQNLFASPENVSLTAAHRVNASTLRETTAVDPEVRDSLTSIASTGDFLLAETVWTQEPAGAYGPDNTLRLPHVQVRLLTFDEDGKAPQLHDPEAFVGQTNAGGAPPFYHPIEDNLTMPFGFAATDVPIRWLFHFDNNREPAYLIVRNLRLPIEEDDLRTNELEAFAEALGGLAPEQESDEDDGDTTRPTTGGGALGGALQQTAELPTWFDDNEAPSVNTESAADDNDGKLVNYGSVTLASTQKRIGRRLRVNAFNLASHQRMVRLKLSDELGDEIVTALRSMPRSEGIYFTNDRGNRIKPFAYVWIKPDGGFELDAQRNRTGFDSVRDMPIRSLNFERDELYLYFLISYSGMILEELHIGEQATRELDFIVE